jgi:hypothetical protein
MKLLMDIIGWLGAATVIVAYGLNSYQKIKSDSYPFQIANLAGGILLIIYAFYKKADANVFINIVWVIIAISSLFKLARKKKSD